MKMATMATLNAMLHRRCRPLLPRDITVLQLHRELLIDHARRQVYESFDEFCGSLDVVETFLRPLDYLNSPLGECFLCQ